MGEITALAVSEAVRIDARRVGDILRELGETAANNVIGQSLEYLAVALSELDDAFDADDRALVVEKAHRISQLSWQIGLTTLTGVAIDLGQCVERGDDRAIAAVRARLIRVGNQSLTRIWDG